MTATAGFPEFEPNRGSGKTNLIGDHAARFWASGPASELAYPGGKRTLDSALRLYLAGVAPRFPEATFDALFLAALEAWPDEDLSKWKGEKP